MGAAHKEGAKLAILGAGSWGGTLAWLYGTNGQKVSLWSHDPEKASALAQSREIRKPLQVALPGTVAVTGELKEALAGADLIIFACTSQSMRAVAETAAPLLTEDGGASGAGGEERILISAAKGLELTSLLRMSQVLNLALPGYPVCALSGPNLAVEILKGLPTASVVASQELDTAARVQRRLNLPLFRIYSNDDVAGVELGGTLKNIIAIAAGISDGLDLGANAKAALLTRGLAEMTRLAVALGARPLTLAGLSGMGDLFATCTSPLSRNYGLGFNLARGATMGDALEKLGATAEGVTTTEAVCELSRRLGIELPIADQVYATLKGKATPREAIMTLMRRPLASE